MVCGNKMVLLLLANIAVTASIDIKNEEVIIDMVQNNPGDAVAWEQSKYFDPAVLKNIGYTGQTSTGEQSGTQAVDFSSTGHDYFPTGSIQRLWLDAYAKGVKRFVDRAQAAGVKAYFFVDLLVFPKFVLDAWPNATQDGRIVWNNASKQLLGILVDETFMQYPNISGWIVRTGETYTYDTPFHVGNSPSEGIPSGSSASADLWVDFISNLRDMVCIKHGKQLFFRGWDNWPSDADFYTSMTNRIEPSPLLYFSIKHSAADFIRPAAWNPQLGVGQHAQIVEVELQREYEGKQSYPNYVMSGVINGFPEMSDKIGLKDIINAPQTKGLWTWTRGGGWWGPYIHGNEQWIDLHAQVLVKWWLSKGNVTEEKVFEDTTPNILPGCDVASGCAAAFRNFSLNAAQVVLNGQWGAIYPCGDWMRDDRIGGLQRVSSCLSKLGSSDDKWSASLAEKVGAKDLTITNLAMFESQIKPFITDSTIAEIVEVSTNYAVYLYSIVAAGWPLLQQAYRIQHNLSPYLNNTQLVSAIAAYDAAFSAYRAFGLAEVYAASLYHDYYLCLGTTCNGAFSPRQSDFGSMGDGYDEPGIGATVDSLRPNRTGVVF